MVWLIVGDVFVYDVCVLAPFPSPPGDIDAARRQSDNVGIDYMRD